MAKNVTSGEASEDIIPIADDVVLEVPAEIVVGPGVAPVAVKRALGVKEPIIFKWKVVGTSQNMVMTLYKSVEREEADAHAERLLKEGYYGDVRVLEASAKIEQPTPAPPKKTASRSEPATKAAAKSTEAVKKPARPAPGPKKPAPAKKVIKGPAKVARRKTASAASSKRTAKGR